MGGLQGFLQPFYTIGTYLTSTNFWTRAMIVVIGLALLAFGLSLLFAKPSANDLTDSVKKLGAAAKESAS